MSIVTLLSDWGLSDHYVAAVKGKLYREWPDVQIVDISHQINKFSIIEAAYVLKNAYPNFPDNTIHCIGINDIAYTDCPHVLVYEDKQFFIGADNGIFPLIFSHKPQNTWKILLESDGSTKTFPSLDLFPLVASHIGQGGSPEEIGEFYDWEGRDFTLKTNMPIPEIIYNEQKEPIEGSIHAHIIYIDSYGNAVTNIDKMLFDKLLSVFNSFKISVRKSRSGVQKIEEVYNDSHSAEFCSIFLSNNYLELSLTGSSAAQLLGLGIGTEVFVHFTNKK